MASPAVKLRVPTNSWKCYYLRSLSSVSRCGGSAEGSWHCVTAASTIRERMVDVLGYLCSGATVRHADAVYARLRLRRLYIQTVQDTLEDIT